LKSSEDIKFRDRVIKSLSATEVEIKAIKSDTERIIKRLDDLSTKVQVNERNISKINGIMALVFTFFGAMIGIVSWYK